MHKGLGAFHMDYPLHLLSAVEILQGYRSRKLSPVEVTEACLGQIERLNPSLNAFCIVEPERSLEAALASHARWQAGRPFGPLDGMPVSIKDLVIASGWPFRLGSRATKAEPAVTDAPSVARLREQGAVLLGKTTTSEFGFKGVTNSRLTGITRNPWNPDLTPGGSSGGAAVAAATGMAPINLGTDGGGSIRIPASFTGVFGHKPTTGVVPAFPTSAFGHLGVHGPITRHVADAALMLRVIAQPDRRDWAGSPYRVQDLCADLHAGVEGLRLGYARTINAERVETEVADAVENAVGAFSELGAAVVPVAIELPDLHETCRVLWSVGAATAAASIPREQRGLMEPELQETIERGERISAVAFRQAQMMCADYGRRMNELYSRCDLVALPTMPLAPFSADMDYPVETVRDGPLGWTPLTFPFNMTMQPACSAPCGTTADGRPIGLQIVAPAGGDALVLRAAQAFELARPWPLWQPVAD